MTDVPTGPGPSGVPLDERVRALMPRLTDELAALVGIPSISEHGYAEGTRPELRRAHEAVLTLFCDAGCRDFSSIELSDTAPIITGGIPATAGGTVETQVGREAGMGHIASLAVCRCHPLSI